MMKKLLVVLLCLFLTGCAGEESEVLLTPQATPAPVASSKTTAAPSLESIKGNWHGYWEAYICTESWQGMENKRWECWAEVDDDSIYLWDEDLPKDLGLADIGYCKGKDGYSVTGGFFMDVSDEYDNWRLSLENGENGPQLVLRGQYDSESPGRFSFVFYLEKDN